MERPNRFATITCRIFALRLSGLGVWIILEGSMKLVGENKQGFTIVELLIVIVVIAILAAITIVAYNGVTARAKTSKAQTDASSILKKLELYRNESSTGSYPLDTNQNWYNQSDLSGVGSEATLPSSLSVVRGDDNAADSAADFSLVEQAASSTPATYAFVACIDTAASVVKGVKVAYPDYSSNTVQWVRTGNC